MYLLLFVDLFDVCIFDEVYVDEVCVFQDVGFGVFLFFFEEFMFGLLKVCLVLFVGVEVLYCGWMFIGDDYC